jgi:hypothetical protein
VRCSARDWRRDLCRPSRGLEQTLEGWSQATSRRREFLPSGSFMALLKIVLRSAALCGCSMV